MTYPIMLEVQREVSNMLIQAAYQIMREFEG